MKNQMEEKEEVNYLFNLQKRLYDLTMESTSNEVSIEPNNNNNNNIYRKIDILIAVINIIK